VIEHAELEVVLENAVYVLDLVVGKARGRLKREVRARLEEAEAESRDGKREIDGGFVPESKCDAGVDSELSGEAFRALRGGSGCDSPRPRTRPSRVGRWRGGLGEPCALPALSVAGA